MGKLYERCPACAGTRKAVRPMLVDGLAVKGMTGTYSGPITAGYPCPCCSDGYVETGLTTEQVEKMAALWALHHTTAAAGEAS